MVVDSTGIGATAAKVAGAIRRAAQATGASFDYLLATAKVESNLNPSIKAQTSSAAGLFQFTDQTWLATLQAAGPELGYGRYADAIVPTPSGSFAVPDPAMRKAILALRNDPTANAAMAGAFTRHNGAALRTRLGRQATGGELYIAHFLGSSGAARLITLAENTPSTTAAKAFPAAAAANRAIFYDRQGNARSVADVYRTLVGRFETARAQTHNMMLAATSQAGALSAQTAAAITAAADHFSALGAVPIASTAEIGGSAFDSLFQTGGRHQPISPVVAALWGGTGASEARATVMPPPTPVRIASPAARHFDLRGLYQDMRSNIRSLFTGTS